MAEIDSSTALYYIVNLLARILKKWSLSLNSRVAMPEIQNPHRREKNSFGFLSNISFIICGIRAFDAI